MPCDDQELRAIAFLAMRVRRSTYGAGPWDEAGLMTNLRKIADRNLHMTVEHVLRHAADPKAKSPGVIVGHWTPEAPKDEPKRVGPPKRDQECPHHPGQYADNCGGCQADQRADDEHASPPRPREPVDPTAPAAAIRAALRGATP